MFHVRRIAPAEALPRDHVLIAGDHVLFDADPAILHVHTTPDGGADLVFLRPDAAPWRTAGFGDISPLPHTIHLGPADPLTIMRNL